MGHRWPEREVDQITRANPRLLKTLPGQCYLEGEPRIDTDTDYTPGLPHRPDTA